MISVDRVYKAVLFFVNSDMRGNVKPDELRLAINTAVEDIVEGYFTELNRALNRQNRGLSGSGLENLPDRIRERLLYFLTEDDLVYDDPVFNLPSDLRYIDAVLYGDVEVTPCKNNREFKAISTLEDALPTADYPIYLRVGDDIKILPDTIDDDVSISYLRKQEIANWTYTVVGTAEVYNPSAADFQDIDLHPSEEYNVIIKTCGYFGVNLRESDIVNMANVEQQQEFNQDNAV